MSSHMEMDNPPKFFEVRLQVSPNKAIASDPIEEQDVEGAFSRDLIKEPCPICSREPASLQLARDPASLSHDGSCHLSVRDAGAPLIRKRSVRFGETAGKVTQ